METILHVMMNNISNKSVPTPEMVYGHCKEIILPLLTDSRVDLGLSYSLGLNPAVKAVSKTMLAHAIKEGDLNIVMNILSAPGLGLDANTVVTDSTTRWFEATSSSPLCLAVWHGHVDIVDALINRFGADVNKVCSRDVVGASYPYTIYLDEAYSSFGWRFCPPDRYRHSFPLENAFRRPRIDVEKRSIARLLLDAGAKICVQDLITVGLHGDMPLFRMIIARTVISRPWCFDWIKAGCLQRLATRLDFQEFMLFARFMGLSIPEIGSTSKYSGLTPAKWELVFYVPQRLPNVIDIYLRRGHLEAVEALMSLGIPFTENTMLAALETCDPSVIKFVLDRGVVLDCFSRHFRTTPLAETIRSHKHRWTREILQRLEQRVLYSDEQSYCACLAAAAESGDRILITKLLTEKRWLRNDVLGYALTKACEANHTDISIQLIESGAILQPLRCTGVFGFLPFKELLRVPRPVYQKPTTLCDHGSSQFIYDMEEFGEEEVPSLLGPVLQHRNAAIYWTLFDHGGVDTSRMAECLFRHGGVDTSRMTDDLHTEGILSRQDDRYVRLAMAWGDHAILQSLLSVGFDLTIFLEAAIESHNYDLAKPFIQQYQPPQKLDIGRVLKAAIRTRSPSIVRSVLVDGHDNLEHPDLARALKSSFKHDSEIFALLLERCCQNQGSDLVQILAYLLDSYKGNKAHYVLANMLIKIACDYNQLIASLVQQSFELAFKYEEGRTNLLFEDWKVDIIEELLAIGANARVTLRPSLWTWGSLTQSTPLLLAIESDNLRLVRMLILAGADVNATATATVRRTPLQLATETGSKSMIDLLIDFGADVHSPCATRGGATPLQIAAIGGNIGLMEFFLRLGARPRELGAKADGRTALEGAAEHGHFSAVTYLTSICSYDADECSSALGLAQSNSHQAVVDFLDSILEDLPPCEAQGEQQLTVDELMASMSLDLEFEEPDALAPVEQTSPSLEYHQHWSNRRVEEVDHTEAPSPEYFGDLGNTPAITNTETFPPIQPPTRETAAELRPFQLTDAQTHTPELPSGVGSISGMAANYEQQSDGFACHLCTGVFRRKDTFKRHLDTHDKKRFKCSRCPKDFCRNDRLNLHLREEHGVAA